MAAVQHYQSNTNLLDTQVISNRSFRSLLIYFLTSYCLQPPWSQLLMVVSIVLERNPELEFQEKVDLDSLVKEAFNDFQKDRICLEGAGKQVCALPLTV